MYEEGSPLSDEHGFRKDVLHTARDLRIPILRWQNLVGDSVRAG